MKSLFLLAPAVAVLSGCVAYADPYGAHGYSGAGYGYGYSQRGYVDAPAYHGHGHGGRRARDRDGDGVSNRHDRRPDNPHRY
jgi:hypothetical protein